MYVTTVINYIDRLSIAILTERCILQSAVTVATVTVRVLLVVPVVI